MNIDKFLQDNHYVDSDGCHYNTAEEFICTGILTFCGCGMPTETLQYIRDCMQLLRDKPSIEYSEFEKRCELLFINYGAQYFMWYFLDNNKLTEHGGSVPGWLTKQGEELLDDLIELYQDEKI